MEGLIRTLFILVLAVVTATGHAQSDIQKMDDSQLKKHAAETVAHLHDTMLDPASFVLDNVYVTKANKRGNRSLCYSFRSHKTLGGYA